MSGHNQGDRHQSVRTETGTSLTYNGDWMALFDQASIPTGPFNGRLLAWINSQLSSSYTSLPQAQQAYAVSLGLTSWGQIGVFSPGGVVTPITWDAANKDAAIALSGGDLIATETSEAGEQHVRGTLPMPDWSAVEFTYVTGAHDAQAGAQPVIGGPVYGVRNNNGNSYYSGNGGGAGSGSDAFTWGNNTIMMLRSPTGLYYKKNGVDTWWGLASGADPESDTGAQPTAARHPCCALDNSGDTVTINSTGPFINTLPTGYAAAASGGGSGGGGGGGGGGSTPDPGSDGSSGQPTTSIQAATALDAYGANRPSWNVAGVDYYVGPLNGDGTVRSVYKTLAIDGTPTGFTYDSTNKWLIPNGAADPAQIDGYDLTDVQLYAPSAANFEVLNCKFKLSTTAHQPVYLANPTTTAVFRHCLFDGNKSNLGVSSGFDAIINGGVNGSLTIEYCEFRNVWGDVIQLGNENFSPTLVIRYNLFRNNGWGIEIGGIHPDIIQMQGQNEHPLTCSVWDATIGHNTFLMDDATLHLATDPAPDVNRGNGTQGLFLSECYFGSLDIQANCFILSAAPTDGAGGTGTVSQAIMVAKTQCATTPVICSNYFDVTGIGVQVWNVGTGNNKFANSTATRLGNKSLLTGADLNS
jgi:hypothetical protein